jgi:hypothetical protein
MVGDRTGLGLSVERAERPGSADCRGESSLVDGDSASAGFEVDVAETMREAMLILIGRHRDYGPKNISEAYPDPMTALLVRVGDKMERLRNLHGQSGKTAVYGERVRDSWIDLLNYSAIALMVLDGTWPGLGDGDV